MKRPIVLKGMKVSLGIYTREDMQVLFPEFAGSDLQRYLKRPDLLFYLEGEYEWFDNMRKDSHSRVFAVLLNPKQGARGAAAEPALIGSVGLHNINRLDGNAEIGYMLFSGYWGKGYATEAVGLATKFAFGSLNLRKLYARIMSPNEASSRVLSKNGFEAAGRLKRYSHLISDGYVDELYFELFNPDPSV